MWIPLTVLIGAVVMGLIEKFRPARRWPSVAGWGWRAVAFNLVQVAMVWVAGVSWERWMKGASLGLLSGWHPAPAAAVAYFIHTFIYYWWHRWRHEVPLLWRWCHQLHHSPRRIEVITSFYKHPVEILCNGLSASATLYLLLGISPAAGAAAALMMGFAELFYHWNVSTPRWLGYLIQRPEAHCVHHQRGRHSGNYGDLPIWDLLFGTFENPTRYDGECGFSAEDEARVGRMLRGIDLTAAGGPR